LEPIGEERADIRNGILCALTANLQPGRRRKRFKPEDFMPWRMQKRRTAKDMRAEFEAKAAALAARGGVSIRQVE